MGSRGANSRYGGDRGGRKSSRPLPVSQRQPIQDEPIRKITRPNREEREEPKKDIVAQYKVGQKVSHAKFGKGIVIESKITGGDEEVSVMFKTDGLKKLAASFAKLTVLE